MSLSVVFRNAAFTCALALALVSFGGCPLPGEKPTAAPEAAPAAPAERGPLPPEEQPPPEAPPSDAPPPEAKPVEPGITAAGGPTRGTLPKDVVDEKLKSAQPAVQACYARSL